MLQKQSHRTPGEARTWVSIPGRMSCITLHGSWWCPSNSAWLPDALFYIAQVLLKFGEEKKTKKRLILQLKQFLLHQSETRCWDRPFNFSMEAQVRSWNRKEMNQVQILTRICGGSLPLTLEKETPPFLPGRRVCVELAEPKAGWRWRLVLRDTWKSLSEWIALRTLCDLILNVGVKSNID